MTNHQFSMPNYMFPLIYSDEFLEHLTRREHPEKPERLSAITSALKQAAFSQQIEWRSPTSISQNSPLAMIEEIHSPRYIRKVQEIAMDGGGFLDTDTYVSHRSYDVALLAVNAWLDGVNIVLETGRPAFVLARPPGHHAEVDYGMGFCLFSNAAISAYEALKKPEVDRVAILDWDVHHGNGTQAIVENNPQIAYCSLHQYPCYPGTGKSSERGINNNVLNLPIPPESDVAIYQAAFKKEVLPFLSNFQPNLLLVSAGYDANTDDPLARMNLRPQDYGLFTEYCLSITTKILFGLEGGYDLPTLSDSVLATIEKCLD